MAVTRVQRSGLGGKISKESSFADKINSMIADSLNARQQDGVMERTRKSRMYYIGEHEARSRPQSMGNKVYNKFGELFSKRLSRFTLRKPKFDFKPNDTVSPEIAQAMDIMITDKMWARMERKSDGDFSEKEVMYAMLSGSVHVRIGIDEEFLPIMQPYKCDEILYDPQATGIGDAEYVGFTGRFTIERIKEQYGVTAKPDEGLFRQRTAGFNGSNNPTISDYVSNNSMANVWTFARPAFGLTSSGYRGKATQKATVIEIWMNDYTRVPIPFDDDDVVEEHERLRAGLEVPVEKTQHHQKHIEAHEKEIAALDPNRDAQYIIALESHLRRHEALPDEIKNARTQKKYPFGRQIIYASGEIIRDQEFPYLKHWKNFVVKWDWERLDNNYWGMSFGHHLFDRQDNINHRKNSITLNSNNVNVGTIKVRSGIFKNVKKFTNLIGKIVPVRNPDDVVSDYGQPMPQQFFKEYYDDLAGMEQQSGETAAISGELPAPGTANATIRTLLDQSNQSTGLPLKHYIDSLQKKALAMLHLISVFRPEISAMVNGKQITPQDLANINTDNVEVGIRIATTTREQQVQESIVLYSQGLYDKRAALELMEDPRIEEILRRTDENLMLKAQIEGLAEEYQTLKSNFNTFLNRQQTQEGAGNVGQTG